MKSQTQIEFAKGYLQMAKTLRGEVNQAIELTQVQLEEAVNLKNGVAFRKLVFHMGTLKQAHAQLTNDIEFMEGPQDVQLSANSTRDIPQDQGN